MRMSYRFITIGATLMAISIPLATMQSTNTHATTLYLKGNIVYRERMALPPDTIVDIALIDTTSTTTPDQIVATTKFNATTSSPIPYELAFDNTIIKPNHSYILQANINVDGKPFFSSIGEQTVFNGVENDTQIFVTRAGSDKDNPIKQKLIGSYVINTMEDKKPEGRVPLTIMFLGDGRASIYAGCNNMFADYKVSPNKLSFSPLLATQMLCSENIMKQEKRVANIINRVQKYAFTNEGLKLQDVQAKTLLELSKQD